MFLIWKTKPAAQASGLKVHEMERVKHQIVGWGQIALDLDRSLSLSILVGSPRLDNIWLLY